MEYIFGNCKSLIYLNLSHFNTENVIDMTGMFYCCDSLKELDLSGFNTLSVNNISRLFNNCTSLLSIDLTNFYFKNNIKMNNMFLNCKSLTSLIFPNFKYTNDMYHIFYGCNSLTYVDISGFITTKKIILFYNIPNNCIIIINKKSENKIEDIPSTCQIIYSE